MRLAVLASGSGTILQSIIEAGVEVTLVVTDRPCGATEIAAAAGVSCVVVTRTSFAADFD
ncbi:MAG: phosphoribosylglycinamide formyltransferase, partial [Acidimicrobiales bacterium]